MNQLENLNHALTYIEEHLKEEINYQEVAKHALCSEYHFKRMFSFLAGLPVSEYIRRRRLTLAAFDLQNGRMRIIDIALNYGYNSPDAFTKAFQLFHGVLPSEARTAGTPLNSFPRMTFQLTIRGGDEMKYRVEEKEAFHVAGFMKRVPVIFEGVNPEISAMLQSLDTAAITELKQLSNMEPKGIISASANFSDGRMQEQGELDHYIGVATTLEAPEHYARLAVPAMTWAVFESLGPYPATLQNIWGRIYSEWFPSSNYESAEGPELVWNEGKDLNSPTYRSEIWIPVMRRL